MQYPTSSFGVEMRGRCGGGVGDALQYCLLSAIMWIYTNVKVPRAGQLMHYTNDMRVEAR